MDFSLTSQQVAQRDRMATVGRQLNDGLAERDARGEFNSAGWQVCVEAGVLGLTMPRRYGGCELDLQSALVALEGLGYGCCENALLFSLGAQIWSVQTPILIFGSDAQKDRFLPPLIAGRMVGAHAVTERAAGSDAFSLQTTAVRDGDSYVLTGTKTYITNAPVADLFLIMTTVDRTRGADGLTAFLVERGTPGLSLSAPLEKMGLRTAMMGEIHLAECRVPADHLLGREGGGTAVFNVAMEWERACIMAPALGTMQRQIEETLQYANTRRQFGQTIGTYESVASRLVEMQTRLDTARLLSYRTAWLKGTGRRLGREPSQVKLYVSESWVQLCLDVMQIHGASGYLVERGVERDLRDALASRIYSGTSEIQRKIIARFLGL